MAGRAKAGGEVGKNGEFYKGGSFLPSTQLPKRSAASRKSATRRVLVRPGVFDVCPADKRAVFGRLHSIIPFVDGKAVALADDATPVKHYFHSVAEMHALVELYNQGVLFYDDGMIANLITEKV